jgi:hypothetical protein
MPISSAIESRRWLIGLLILISAMVISFVIAIPSTVHRPLGACRAVIGTWYIAMHRIFGRQAHRQAQSIPLAAGFWNRLGIDGAQSLHLGIGVILTCVGCFLLIKSA